MTAVAPQDQAAESLARGPRALELRMAGATYRQIAQALNVSTTVAWTDVQRTLKQENERVADLREEYRDLQLARCERLIRGIWATAVGGDLDAVKQCVAIMDRQARYIGLDAPVQIHLHDDSRTSMLNLLAELESAMVIPGTVEDDEDDEDSAT